MDERIRKAKKKLERKVLKMPGVQGVGYDGESFIIYVENEAISLGLKKFKGIPVRIVVSGKFYALANEFFRPNKG